MHLYIVLWRLANHNWGNFTYHHKEVCATLKLNLHDLKCEVVLTDIFELSEVQYRKFYTKWLNYDNCNNIFFLAVLEGLKVALSKSIEQNKAALILSPCVMSICLRCCGCMQSNSIWWLSQTDLRTISEDNPIETGSWATKPYRKTPLHSPSHFRSPCFVVYFFFKYFQFNRVYLNG